MVGNKPIWEIIKRVYWTGKDNTVFAITITLTHRLNKINKRDIEKDGTIRNLAKPLFYSNGIRVLKPDEIKIHSTDLSINHEITLYYDTMLDEEKLQDRTIASLVE